MQHKYAREMMATPLNRRQFLRGDFQARRSPLRPPWAVAEKEFTGRCTTCGDCVRACPNHILIAGGRGLPEIDFSRGECGFCGECADACKTEALSRKAYKTLPWVYHAVIDDEACLTSRGVVCASCREACAASAIRLPPRAGMAARPILNIDACTGCGACVAPCPVNAIHVRPRSAATDSRHEEPRCT